MPDSIKIMFVSANPNGTARLQLNEEFREIDQKIRASKYRDALELVPVLAARRDDIIEALLRHQPQIVHFSGHGSRERGLYLLDDEGNSSLIGRAALLALIESLKDNIRVVVLNACHSHELSQAVVSVVESAIGMDAAIEDRAAIKFACAFYLALGYGRSVQDAFQLGTVAMGGKTLPLDRLIQLERRELGGGEETPPNPAGEGPIPQFYTRPGVDPSRIVLIDERKSVWKRLRALSITTKLLTALIAIGISVIGVAAFSRAGRGTMDGFPQVKAVSLESDVAAFKDEVDAASDLVERAVKKAHDGVNALENEQTTMEWHIGLPASDRRNIARRFQRMFRDYISILNGLESVCLDSASLVQLRKNLDLKLQKFSEERITQGGFDGASQIFPGGDLFQVWLQFWHHPVIASKNGQVPDEVNEIARSVSEKWTEAKTLCFEFIDAVKAKDNESLKVKQKKLYDSLGTSDAFQTIKQAAQRLGTDVPSISP